MPEPEKQISPFLTLRRLFVSRLLDFDLLATAGDPARLVGQVATLLASISLAITLPLLLISELSRESLWGMEHFLIVVTMTATGLFGIVSWEAIFPERNDLMVLGSLPVQRTTMFFAKLSALAEAQLLVIIALNSFTGIGWAIQFEPKGGGLSGLLRTLVAYWITMLLAGAFAMLCVLAVHGVSSLCLPRQAFLRASSWLQLAGFMLVLGIFILEPSLESIPALTAPQNQILLHSLPSYWLLSLFQVLNGSALHVFIPLARLAIEGLAVAVAGALLSVLIAYFRVLPTIVEEPDIQPTHNGWIQALQKRGDSVQSAVLAFTWRTLLRSRRHRLMLGFFFAIGLIVLLLYLQIASPAQNGRESDGTLTESFLVGSLIMLCVAVLGARIAISVPVFLKANWIFQLTQTQDAAAYRAASLRSLFTVSVVPVWLLTAAACLWMRSGWAGVFHLITLAMLGVVLVDLALIRLRKLPFVCSWMPGKTNLLVIFFGGLIIGVPLANRAGMLEMYLLAQPTRRVILIVTLLALIAAARWGVRLAEKKHTALVFEEKEAPAMLFLNLERN